MDFYGVMVLRVSRELKLLKEALNGPQDSIVPFAHLILDLQMNLHIR